MNPFGFTGQTRSRPLEPLYFELKRRASDLALQIMEETGLEADKMRDVCFATLLSYRVQDKEECIKSCKLIYKKCYGLFTKLLVAIQHLEEYCDHTFTDDEEDDGHNTYMAVLGLVGYSTFHNQEKFLGMIAE